MKRNPALEANLAPWAGVRRDGVNDAPAVKKADVGIAVSGATDAARAAADIVLLTPGLSVIINAIKEARKIFQRMISNAIYRITETIRVVLLMTIFYTQLTELIRDLGQRIEAMTAQMHDEVVQKGLLLRNSQPRGPDSKSP